MKALQDLEIFVRTADTASLSATARGLGITPAAASAALKRLEAEVGVQLFLRSTRHLRLTSEGEVFLAQCRPALSALQQASLQLASGGPGSRGQLKLAAPSDLGRNVLLPWLNEFQDANPGVDIRLHLSDRLANVYSEPIDAAFRYGHPADSNLVALPLAPTHRRVLCAAPSYLRHRGTPASPLELQEHDCLCFMLGDDVHDRWKFERNGQPATFVRVRAVNVSNDGDVVRRWALLGKGIAYKSYFDVAQDLASGRLHAICEDWQGESTPLYLLVAGRQQITPLLRQLHQFMQERLEHWEQRHHLPKKHTGTTMNV
ncbi:LysR family transcriptional regulator [Alcaligenes faecalis]|uniref:LysR family transcriptional regulator n=1 Tax=Alcaligenes faecalis TaxID=511 RepID=UPI000A2E6714|nr:LysR family transcriptional regulator [Alcaligenes faecalis]MBY6310679.1 LysR family transcriptional regulator [Alcaligenes faecalis]MBY6318556.1 LysR family transcriptional regulator [Alcaligenes faecalis]MBY6392638.1 LysR family transcriptional regulator [Alcaligenes faecalis]OSZ44681.1 LysR family transcriptional regulator [Alcaligenes faecalis]OSZ48149.1 LysR family transcriptional regulator [Alcaligenes faecalis]